MQLAIVDGGRVEAFPAGQGSCPTCGAAMVAKCGPRIVHHWAHAGRRNCDPWWENETDWHRDWKNHFPLECREVSHTAPDGEVHRADVKTQTGIYVEIQHSAMTDEERLSRETFYQNLVWVVDGRSFRKNFALWHFLPDPKAAMSADLVWYRAQGGLSGANDGMFWRRSENPDVVPGGGGMVLVHPLRDIEHQVMENYRGHQQYTWTRPRSTWLSATCPVYIDFGDGWLFRLDCYDSTGLRCVFRVAKAKFLHDLTVETRASEIASRFYPVT
jgi:hypothetical protein